ncbi:MAG: cytochrome c biogenesis protein CcdA [Proteobacteria bacterium]|nr:cytochrome c biogenesis protein CcdA [Pseudomonadota bacterium]
MLPVHLPAEAALAFAAGLLTIAAPCVLPLLPAVLGGALGATRSLTRPLWIVAGFVAAFAGVTLAFGASATWLGLTPDGLRHAAVAGLLLFGVLMVWPAPMRVLARHGSAFGGAAARWGGVGEGAVGALLLGASLGAVWTPCAGPVLGAILTLLATAPSGNAAAALLLSYAVGAGVPMLVIGYGGQWAARRVRAVAAHLLTLQRVSGVLLIVVALAMAFQVDALVVSWLSRFLPSLSQGL